MERHSVGNAVFPDEKRIKSSWVQSLKLRKKRGFEDFFLFDRPRYAFGTGRDDAKGVVREASGLRPRGRGALTRSAGVGVGEMQWL